MTSLKSKLQEDLTGAIKARDELRSATLRLTLSAVTKEEVSGSSARELDDDEVQKVIAREAKKRREAADAFAKGGRAEQAERERAEGEILAAYLPKPLTDEELEAIVADAVAQAKAGGAEGRGAMGAVMKIVTPRVDGRAEGGRVAGVVRRLLGQ
ncbi:GatB/YqeY domain-containing protein [Streptomyces montanisoli]|uniref:GatB/YqeY domain-containing protein n=1 Tax=Streptomyces montanisoli TaxID=2798581 RepID=A0A940MCI5_9ACTN|nr:GatB/YqeY domain-containing protein [Streptomyces montanisoli]MBP0456526.1 GatB/YqeY domain-containing protein [Streptomyces montanisoli]